MSASIARRLQALERAVHATQASGLPDADKALLQRSMLILMAHVPGTDVEDFSERLANGTPTDADRDTLRQLAQAGQPDPAGFVGWAADLIRSI